MNIKHLIISATLSMVAITASAQDKFFTKTGHIKFFSTTPMENIEAHNRQVSSVIDTKTGAIEFGVLMRSFKFEKALMEEHFNENYVESDKFPKSTFKGTISNISEINFTKDGEYNAKVSGNLTIHGVTKPVEGTAKIIVKGGKVQGTHVFTIAPEDYDIKIPAVVRDKIAKTIEITVNCDYEPLKK